MWVRPSKLELNYAQDVSWNNDIQISWAVGAENQLTPLALFHINDSSSMWEVQFHNRGCFHNWTIRKRHNKTHLIFARNPRRCRGVYWCRVLLAWGLPKYQSHTRLQIIYVHVRARASSTTFTRRQDSAVDAEIHQISHFFSRREVSSEYF